MPERFSMRRVQLAVQLFATAAAGDKLAAIRQTKENFKNLGVLGAVTGQARIQWRLAKTLLQTSCSQVL